jgi:hypothetical protein
VSAGAVDQDGGELTAIAHCAEDPSLPLTEVSASASVKEGEAATATTPRCPPGRALTAGGFSFNGSHDALFAEGYFTRRGTWSATGYGWFGPVELTAYGYCLKAADTVNRASFPAPRASPADGDEDGSLIEDLGAPIYVAVALVACALVAWILQRRRPSRRADPR